MNILREKIILIVLTRVIAYQAITVTGNLGGPHNETYHVFQNLVSWYEAYSVCEKFGHTFPMIGPYQAECLMNALKTEYGQNFRHTHVWTGAVQPRYTVNIYDVDLCGEVDLFEASGDVLSNNSFSVCSSLNADDTGTYFLENCEENYPFICIDQGDAITTDGLFESISHYAIHGDFNKEQWYSHIHHSATTTFDDCIDACRTRIKCFASVFDSNIIECSLMLDKTSNFMTQYEINVPYSNEPGSGIFSVYVKTTRVYIELQDFSGIFQASFPCNFEYGSTITDNGIMKTTIGDDENTKVIITDVTTQEPSSEERNTTQEPNSDNRSKTQRQNTEERITTREPNSEDRSTTQEQNSEEKITTQEPNSKDRSTTERPNSEERTTTQILDSEKRTMTQEPNSEDRFTTQESNSEKRTTTQALNYTVTMESGDGIITTDTSTQKPNIEDTNTNLNNLVTSTMELRGAKSTDGENDSNVTYVPCQCNPLCTPKANTEKSTAEDLQKALTIDKKTFSSYKRTLICIKDFRPSANAIGGFAVGILSIVFGIIILSDILLLFRRTINITHLT